MSSNHHTLSGIGRCRPEDRVALIEAARTSIGAAFQTTRSFEFFLDATIVRELAGGASPDNYAARFAAIRGGIYDRLARGQATLLSRLQYDARLCSRLGNAIRYLHMAASRVPMASIVNRRFVLIKEALGEPTLCHLSAASTLLASAGPGPQWQEIPSIYLGLNLIDVLRIAERKGDAGAMDGLVRILALEERSIQTGYAEIVIEDGPAGSLIDALVAEVLRIGSIPEQQRLAAPPLVARPPFRAEDRQRHLQLLNARLPGDELNFHYDDNLRGIESLEELARHYKRASDEDSLREVFRLLVAASAHDVHEIRHRANLALERILAPKEYDAPLATRFITLKAGDWYHFSFDLPAAGDYFLRLYRLQEQGTFALHDRLDYRDLDLIRDPATGRSTASCQFDQLGQVDFVVLKRLGDQAEWLHEPGLSGRVSVIPDVRGEIILEIFVDIHGHTRIYWSQGDGHPGLVYNESGEIIRLGTFDDVAAHLADLQQRYFITAVYLLGIQQRGSNREDWAPEASSPSPFSPMSLVAIEPTLGGEAAFERLVQTAHGLGIKVIVDIMPHLNRHSAELGDENAVQCYDAGGNLVIRASTDGRYGSWNDGKLLNYRRLEVWDWLANSVVTLVEKYDIDGGRFDSAHAVPVMMKRNNDLKIYYQPRTLEAMVEGTIVTNDRVDEHFQTTGYYDSACRDLIAVPTHQYLMQHVERALRRLGKRYFINLAECYWGHERYLARSGIIPYNSALFKICESITHGTCDVSEIYHVYDHYFPSSLPEGTVMLGILGNHDERRALNTFGERGLRPAVALTVFLSDIVMDYEGNAEGENWKVFLDNINVNWNQFESVSHRSLERFYRDWFQLHRRTRARGQTIWANNPMVAAAVRCEGRDLYLGAFNFATDNQAAALQFDNPRLPIDPAGFYRVVDPLYSPITGHYNYYTGRELRVSKLRTVVSYVERVKLLKLEWSADPGPAYDAFLHDSFSRLCELDAPEHFPANFAFAELQAHSQSFRQLATFIKHHLVDKLPASRRNHLHLGLKRAFFHLYRQGTLTHRQVFEYLDKLCRHTDAAMRELGNGIKLHNEAGPLVFLSAEAEPFSKSGGLANVVYELPRQLARLGETVYSITPMYAQGTEKSREAMRQACLQAGVAYSGRTVRFMIMGDSYEVGIHTGNLEGVHVILLENGLLFDGLYWGITAEEKLRRRIGFARACAETIRELGLRPLFTFTNDAFAGIFNGIVRSDPLYVGNASFARNTFLHVIHNGGWQYFDSFNRWERGFDLYNLFNLPPWRDHDFLDPVHPERINCMATGVRFADRVFTVSPSYARQIEYASDGLERLLHRVIGISNGIGHDFECRIRRHFDQSGFVDHHRAWLQEEIDRQEPLRRKLAANYPELLDGLDRLGSIRNPVRRAIVERMSHKLMLQLDRGLTLDPEAILFVMIHRITDQKGFQLLLEASEGIFKTLGYQAIVGGAVAPGDSRGEELASGLWNLGNIYRSQVNVSFGFQDIAVPFLAGDLVGMPSMTEPGGLVQIEAFACGSLVLARATGGLRDTVTTIHTVDGELQGNGFLFSDYTPWAFYDAMERAARFFRETPPTGIWQARQNARRSVFHWERPARQYVDEAYAIKEIIRPPTDE